MTGGRVLVLGRSGRNFAAGMSGGIAYVYDVDGDFASRCNMGMVALEPLDDSEDLDLVHGLMERHREYTGSTVAAELLGQWPAIAQKFVKVMPLDYRRVLEEQAREQAAQGEVSDSDKVGAAHG
jgi:glutamate synthase (ferredoxin)